MVSGPQMERHFFAREKIQAISGLHIVIDVPQFRAFFISGNGSFQTFIKRNRLIYKFEEIVNLMFKNTIFSMGQNSSILIFLSHIIQIIISLKLKYFLLFSVQNLVYRSK